MITAILVMLVIIGGTVGIALYASPTAPSKPKPSAQEEILDDDLL